MKKVIVSLFILFHWFCVMAWVLPKPSPFKTWLLTWRIPTSSRYLVETYLYSTAQWQDWSMFAPNPLQANRYLAARIVFADGRKHYVALPRLSQLGPWRAWINKRYRKYQHRIIDDGTLAFREDLARYLARRSHRVDRVPTRVILSYYEAAIPRHDRPELVTSPGWVDYTALLRHKAKYTATVMLDYTVQEKDLL